MKILVDTHVALWLFNDYENLSQVASDYLRDEKNELYISIASAWEVAIKHSLGKLPEFDGGVQRFLHAIQDNPIQIIGIHPEYVKRVEDCMSYKGERLMKANFEDKFEFIFLYRI